MTRIFELSQQSTFQVNNNDSINLSAATAIVDTCSNDLRTLILRAEQSETDQTSQNLPLAPSVLPNCTDNNERTSTEHAQNKSINDEWNELTEEEAMMFEQETLLDFTFVPDTGIRIAPGEGKTPTSLLFDTDVNELSFSHIYCGEMRPIREKVSMAQIAKAEARMHDRRCAEDYYYSLTQYIDMQTRIVLRMQVTCIFASLALRLSCRHEVHAR